MKIYISVNEKGELMPACKTSKEFMRLVGEGLDIKTYLYIASENNEVIMIRDGEDIKKTLSDWRKGKNWTQEEAANFFKVAKVTYGGWERTGSMPLKVSQEINMKEEVFL